MASLSRVRSGGSSAGGPSRNSSAGDNTPTSCLDDDDRGSLEPYLPAVVQVFTSSAANDWCMPWSKALPEKSTGSGWIFDVKRRIIVTNAHVVEFASTLQVSAGSTECALSLPSLS
jgi:S1-C subfamily serine protease